MEETHIQIQRRTSSASTIVAAGAALNQEMHNHEQGDAKEALKDITAHTVPLEELLSDLSTDPSQGLSSAMASQRLEVDGPNALTPPPKTPEIVKFIQQLTGFFSLLLWAGAILCFIGYALREDRENLYLGIVLAAVVTITGIFSYAQERKADNMMAAFSDMLAETCTVVRDGKAKEIDARELVCGDIVRIKNGDKVPADIRIVECSEDLKVENASITGEPEPQKRSLKCTNAENPLETQNLAFFGTPVKQGEGVGVVYATGDNTVIGKIKQMVSGGKKKMSAEEKQRRAKMSKEERKELEQKEKQAKKDAQKQTLNVEISHFVHIVSGVAMVLGVSFFIIGLAIGTDFITNLVFMIGIIVANVPEGLLATVTVCLTLTAKRMVGKQVLIRYLDGVETLGSTTCICSDKTGTLTINDMTAVALVYNNEVHKASSQAKLRVEADVFERSDLVYRRLERCMTLCNNSDWLEDSKFEKAADKKTPDRSRPLPFHTPYLLGDGSEVYRINWQPDKGGNASDNALIKLVQPLRDISEYREESPKVAQIPFNSTNKFQVTIHVKPDGGHIVLLKGAPERVMERCSHLWRDGALHEFTPELRQEAEELQTALSREGLRVLGFAELELDPHAYPRDYNFDADALNFPMGASWQNPDEIDWTAPGAPDRRATEPLHFLGMVALIDPPRAQVPGAVAKCAAAGIKTIMVTGDHPITAKAIAKWVGIIKSDTEDDILERHAKDGFRASPDDPDHPAKVNAIVVPGWTISGTTSQERWDDILSHNQIVFARTSPEQKRMIVLQCRRRGEVVAVTGDGVNDAPALSAADIGVAMGIMGTPVTKDVATMILLDDNFASIVAGVEEGRLIFDNLKKSIAYTLSSNIPEIAPFIMFITFGLPLPLSTILILCVDLGTDMVPAISMAWETAESDIMQRPPRDAKVDRLVTRKLISFAYLQIGMIQALAGFYTYYVVLNDYGYPPDLLFGLGRYDNWGKQVLYCKLDGGFFYNVAGEMPATYNEAGGFIMWDPINGGSIDECLHAARNIDGGVTEPAGFTLYNVDTAASYTNGKELPTRQSIEALLARGYLPYIPYRSKNSVFWDNQWLAWDPRDGDVIGLGSSVSHTIHFQYQPVGTWDVAGQVPTGRNSLGSSDAIDALKAYFGTDKLFYTGTLRQGVNYTTTAGATVSVDGVTTGADGFPRVNVASRMAQSEALAHAQCAYFVSIVVVQWADLVICKTRLLSLSEQGMNNPAMNFGLVFETILAAFLCYLPGMDVALGTRPIRMLHWSPAVFFSLLIVSYDEIRKYLMRSYTTVSTDPVSKQKIRDPSWLERFTFY